MKKLNKKGYVHWKTREKLERLKAEKSGVEKKRVKKRSKKGTVSDELLDVLFKVALKSLKAR